VARALAESEPTVFEWNVENPASHTFHGRDVFAPAAAAVHEAGTESIETLDRASRCTEYADPRFPEPVVDSDEATGEVLVIDGFGNVVTNLPGELLDGRYDTAVRINGEPAPARRAYAAVAPGERLVCVGSHGNVELAANRERGEAAFGLAVGDRVHLSW
jgi:hypothetical protein